MEDGRNLECSSEGGETEHTCKAGLQQRRDESECGGAGRNEALKATSRRRVEAVKDGGVLILKNK